METIEKQLDVNDLEQKVVRMYTEVALHPEGNYHFEIGRGLAEKLGYPSEELNQIPEKATESFAGVGYFFDLANVQSTDTVMDLGSGSGMDSFYAARYAKKVYGVDMTDEQLEKARRCAKENGFENVIFTKGFITELPFEDETCDLVISNGVINLSPDKKKVFSEAARVLRKGGRLALADIVTEQQLPENVVCDATLWASCIGGAAQQDEYRDAIESNGFEITLIRNNPYEFLSKSAVGASKTYGVKSVSLWAVKK